MLNAYLVGLKKLEAYYISDNWTILPIYKYLFETLIKFGYNGQWGIEWSDELRDWIMANTGDINIFFAPYDWRESVALSYQKFLMKQIDKAKERTGATKVDIVAHSMGGLVVRSYIQSSRYRGDIGKFVMLGTPNHGSVSSYFAWEEGNFVDFIDRLGKEKILSNMKHAYYGLIPAITDKDFIRAYIPSIRDLLPTFDFLFQDGNPIGYEEQNTVLSSLNNNLETLTNKGVEIKIFAGEGEETLEKHVAIKSTTGGSTPVTDTWIKSNEGDGTVLVKSAELSGIEIKKDSGKHDALPTLFAADSTRFLLSKETIPEGIKIYTNQSSYKEGDTLTLSYSISNTGDSFKADVFLGFVLTDGSIWFFDESLQNLKPCAPNDSRTYTAALASFDITAGYQLPKTPFFSIILPALPQGSYTAFAALAELGSAKAGKITIIGDVSLATFTFSGS